jgi:hypothetical protein
MFHMPVRLKPAERALLWLAYVEGFDHSEIAAAGIRSKSIRVLLFRARQLAHNLTRCFLWSNVITGSHVLAKQAYPMQPDWLWDDAAKEHVRKCTHCRKSPG